MPAVACIGFLRLTDGGVEKGIIDLAVLEFSGSVGADSDECAVLARGKVSGVRGAVSLASLAESDFGVKGLPHWGQKVARTRMDTPQDRQRRAISGSGIV